VKERDYIIATNLAKIRAATNIVTGICAGSEYGVEAGELRTVIAALYKWTAFLEEAVDSDEPYWRRVVKKFFSRFFGEPMCVLVFLLACFICIVVEIPQTIMDEVRGQYANWQGMRISCGWRKRDYIGKWVQHRVVRGPSTGDSAP
jgi:hypothetical protein